MAGIIEPPMEWSGLLFLDYYSVGSLIAFSMSIVLTVFLFAVPQKSKATIYLAFAFAMIPLMNVGYFFGSTLYHPLAAYHRLFTVWGGCYLGLFITAFFFHYPRNSHPRVAMTYFVFLFSLNTAVSLFFTYSAIKAGQVFHFSGHYWDLDSDQATRLVALTIMVNSLSWTIVGLWRTITLRGRERLSSFGTWLSFFLAGMLQTITNIMSRTGYLDRGVYQTAYSLSIVIGFFLIAVIYLNNTRDRTSFMARLIGISLLTLLLVFQGISYFTLRDTESGHDSDRRYEQEIARLRPDFRPDNIRYIREYSNPLDAGTNTFERESVNIDFHEHQPEVYFAWVRSEIEGIGFDPATVGPTLDRVFQNAPDFAKGYEALLRGAAGRGAASGDDLIQAVSRHERAMAKMTYEIRHAPAAEVGAQLQALLSAEQGPEFAPFVSAMSAAVLSTSLEGEALRAYALRFLAGMPAPNSRRYRSDAGQSEENERHYVTYFQVDSEAGTILETGFSYRAFREYLHLSALHLTMMLCALVFIVVLGFRLFFRGALITPLNVLLGGVRQVNEGDLSVEVPIKVEDEIGFLSHSFNGMVASIREAKRKLQDYADNLEEKVRERTEELRSTLGKVQELKQQQDGDYFLTSLLIRPLGADRSHSETVSVDFLVRQKKRFKFRKWEEEIGGDICMADTIELRGKKHTVFLNADAMGKSMQGAGGALVLGAVFEALIERTQLSGEAQRQFPERWLKYAFIELHKVFESFDGSMLVSLAVGLIEDDTGLLYSINAEHPFTVIYRGGQARFLEEVTEFRKLGTPGLKGSMYIRTYQLEPGDVLIAGSDGRDDIRIKSDDGNTYIADDETEFLRAVEIADGLLGRIVKHLESRGELTDDLSLLRLAYREDAPPAEIGMSQDVRDLYQKARELFREEKGAESVALLEDAASREGSTPDVLRTLAGTAARIRDYEKAARYGTEYAALRPGDTEFLFLLSYSLRKLGRIGEAADYGERVRLREPDHVPNLMNLARCYVRLGNPKRAQQMAEHALSREPENEALQRLCNQLEQARAASQN